MSPSLLLWLQWLCFLQACSSPSLIRMISYSKSQSLSLSSVFLYSTIVFANASGEVLNGQITKFRRHERIGNALSEYLGVYLLVISLPLVINVITTDLYLRTVTIIASLAGLSIYQFSHFSLLERDFKQYKLISVLILLLMFVLFFTQLYSFYFVPSSLIFIFVMILLAYHAAKN